MYPFSLRLVNVHITNFAHILIIYSRIILLLCTTYYSTQTEQSFVRAATAAGKVKEEDINRLQMIL